MLNIGPQLTINYTRVLAILKGNSTTVLPQRYDFLFGDLMTITKPVITRPCYVLARTIQTINQ
jgi:hypothetical protein